jgi:N-acylglucosamine-6-phosphate 2-epimerase
VLEVHLLKRGLIVSCQAEEGSPFDDPIFIAAFAKAAELGGAVAVRIRDVKNIKAVRKEVKLPIIGLTKGTYPSGYVLITPRLKDVEELIKAGTDIIAIDATSRIRPNGIDGATFLREVKKRFDIPIIADISDLNEGIKAAESGADYISTTLSGYTEYSAAGYDKPDLELVKQLAASVNLPVIAEGKFWTPEEAKTAIKLGAHAVCVGTAITRPVEIVRRFVKALQE